MYLGHCSEPIDPLWLVGSRRILGHDGHVDGRPYAVGPFLKPIVGDLGRDRATFSAVIALSLFLLWRVHGAGGDGARPLQRAPRQLKLTVDTYGKWLPMGKRPPSIDSTTQIQIQVVAEW